MFPDAEKCKTVDDRVRYIVGLMASGDWLKKRWYRRDLAAIWGISEATVRKHSAEAHRWLAVDKEDVEEMRAALAARMMDIAERAKSTLNAVTSMPDFQSEIRATQLYGEYMSVAPSKDERKDAHQPVTVEVVYGERTESESPSGEPSEQDPGDGAPGA